MNATRSTIHSGPYWNLIGNERQSSMKRILILSMTSALMLMMSACAGTPNAQTASDGAAVAQVEPTITPFPTAQAAARPTYVVQRGTVQETLEFSGRWLPRDQEQLSFPINGTVRQVNVRPGDAINEGDLLADFTIEDLEDQLANAIISLETAQLRLESDAESGDQAVTNALFNLASSRLNLESTEANAPWTNLENARINLEAAKRNLENAQRDYDDARSRADSSASAVDNAREAVIKAEESVRTSELNYYSSAQSYNQYLYNVKSNENSLIKSELELEQAQAGVGVDPEQLQSVRQAELSVQQIQSDIARSSLFAPTDGVVLEVAIKPGDSVQAYVAVITIGKPEPKEAVVNLAFTDTQRLSIGKIGVCQVANQPDTAVQCIVRQIPLTSRDADQTTRIAASLENVAQGQLIEIFMPLQISEDTLWLPPQAIRTFQNRTFVVLQTPDGQQVADVTIGLQTDDRVEILSGVEEGDIVIAP